MHEKSGIARFFMHLSYSVRAAGEKRLAVHKLFRYAQINASYDTGKKHLKREYASYES
jgi:hypothetical protein